MGRVARASQQTGGVTYGPMTFGYNRAGSPAWETYPSGRTVLFDYDQAGRAKTLSTVGGVTYATLDDAEAAHAYWVNGGIHKMKLGAVNPATQLNYWEHTNYNLRLQPVEIGWGTSAADSSLRRFQYDYGMVLNNGNVLSQTISAAGFTATQSYTYDGVNRLDTSTEGTRRRNHGYDQYGNNWVSLNENLPLSGMTPVAQSWFNAANNRIVGYAYEPSGTGNLTGANGWTYAYDGENRLKQAQTTINGTTYTDTYEYDGDGRRVKKTVGTINTVYVYDAMGQMIAEYTDAPTEQTAATEYVLADHLGSTRAVLDVSTNILSCHDYLPFGEELTAGRESITCYTSTDSVKQKFTGKERDTETGLDYFGARYFSGPQGRFTSPDNPLLDQFAADPQSWNLYSYVRNNPLSNIDPSGEDCITTTNQTENGVTVTVTSGSCSGNVGTYIAGTVDTASLTYNGTSVGYSYTPYDTSSTFGVGNLVLGPAPEPPSPLLLAVAQGTQMASPWVNAAGIGMGAVMGGNFIGMGAYAVLGGGLTSLGLQTAAATAPLLPAVPSAIDKLQKLGITLQEANQIVTSPTAQKLIDNANSGNINVIQDVGGKLIRITLDPTGSRIISAGIVQARNVTNSIASGRFTPLQ